MLNRRIDHYGRNERGRDLIVGDIHGQFAQLAAALQRVQFDTERDRLFGVGDLIDRGSASHQVLAWLAYPWFRTVRGNHEEALIAMLEGDTFTNYERSYGAQWIRQYPRTEIERVATKLQDLPLGIELETEGGMIGILHANMPLPSWAELKRVLADEGPKTEAEKRFGSRAHHVAMCCTWARTRAEAMQRAGIAFGNDAENIQGVRAVVVGHTPMPRVVRGGNVYFIDTVQWILEPNDSHWRHESGELTLLDAATLEPAAPPARNWQGLTA